MNRLSSTIFLDITNQYRQGFYLASVVVVGFFVAFVLTVPVRAPSIVAALLLTNMAIATFVLLGGLVLLEKGEGTLDSLLVSPLRPSEYLASKVGTLTALAVLENLTITGAILQAGWVESVAWPWILVGSVLTGFLYTTIGFLTVIRYESLNDYLIPMVFVLLILEFPATVCLGMPEYGFLWLLPTYALLWLYRSAFEPVPVLYLAYGVIYPLLCLGGAWILSEKSLRAFVAGDFSRGTS